MGTTAEKLHYLNVTKQAIKQAIIDMGVDVSDEDTFRSYADLIRDITGGGGSDLYQVTNIPNKIISTTTMTASGVIG